jgi:hypothetical protein
VLTSLPAAGNMSVGTDAKVYWRNIANTITSSK